jgi:glycosyltransferase involved in cell wall biosynthesis
LATSSGCFLLFKKQWKMGITKKTKILMGIPSKKIRIGGPIHHLPYLVDYFEKKESYIIKTFTYGSKIDGGSLIDKKESIFRKVLNTLQVFILFVYQVIIFRPHIIHINTAFDTKSLIRDVPFSLFAFLFRKKLIFKLHGSSYDLIKTENKLMQFLIKLFFLGATRVGVLSDIERNEFIKIFGHHHKIIVVKNIVLPNKTRDINGHTYFKREIGRTYGLFISRIIKGKGLDDLILSIPQILKTNPGFTLVIAGDGPEKINCTNLAHEINVDKSIIWLGIVHNEHLPQLFSSSDIFIFSSHLPEGMPMSLVEAMRSGIPIITTKVRFAVNYLVEKENCLFVEAGHLNEINDAIVKLLLDKDLQMKMKASNPKMVDSFSQEIVGNEFDQIYRQMLN